ncbi:MAG: Trp family transcriptional regulator [bacterium]|nr:Trp family transcriptional regulator [bacterium]
MPHISQKQLSKKVQKRISQQFFETLYDLKSREDFIGFLNELLTETEQLMLMKRMALIVMTERNIPFKVIEKTLHMSPDTIARYWKRSKTKEHKIIMRRLNKESVWGELCDDIERALLFGMPSRSMKQRRRLGRPL